MAVHHSPAALAARAAIVPAPRRNRGKRAFELHPAVHLMTIAAYLSFVLILTATFMGRDLVVGAGIIVISVVALFLVPALWGRVVPDDGLRKESWAEFLEEGVECITGRLTAGQAMAQILTLPALLLGMGLFFAILKVTL
ncbi:MAG TPA: hypothetical protein VF704_07690 [Allosphingosinicella sp.]|jgi:hypothetical protein